MRRTAITVGLTALAALAVTTSSAVAASLAVNDVSGDATGGPDVTRVVVKNKAHAINARVNLEGDIPGDALVSIDRSKGVGRTFFAVRRANGNENAFLLKGSFDDNAFNGDHVPCPGYSATWDQADEQVRFHMPDQCMSNGSYGKVRFVVLTEAPDGGDSDFAPDDSGGIVWSDWIARG